MEVWYDPFFLDECFANFDDTIEQNDYEQFSLGESEEEELGDFQIKSLKQEGAKRVEDKTSLNIERQERNQQPESFLRKENQPNSLSIETKQQQQQQQTPPKFPILLKRDETLSEASSKNSHHQHHLRVPQFLAGFSMKRKSIECFDCPASAVHVRKGPDYKKNGLKAPSEDSLYELAEFDILRGRRKLIEIHQKIHLPYEAKGQKGLPGHLLVNIQLPNKGPQIFRSSSDIDAGTSLVFYFKLKSQLPPDDTPSIKLASKFFNKEIQGRFKALIFVDNLSDLKIPSLLLGTVRNFNGKPVIIHKSGLFFQAKEKDLFEVDVDVFQFPATARTAFNATKSISKNAKLRIAFVLQGENNDELPERLLACCGIKNLDIDGSIDFEVTF